jgi:cytochrome P450
MLPDWSYKNGYAPFERLGETFIIVAFDKNTLHTCEAELIQQITTRKESFPKPLEAYKILELFGSNVVTTEGQLWRMHRKTTAASFNEKNAVHTFLEAIEQAQGMLDKWFPDGSVVSTGTMRTLEQDTMTLALNIIGYVGFGLRFLWPHQKISGDEDPKTLKYGSRDPSPGFTMGFVEAVSAILHNLLQLLLVPWVILSE